MTVCIRECIVSDMSNALPSPASTPRQPSSYSTRARARRLEARDQADSAHQAEQGRCDCGLPLPCATCAKLHLQAVKSAFVGL